jgi:hypothetical protein
LLLGTGIGIGGSALAATIPYCFAFLSADGSGDLAQFGVSVIIKYFPAVIGSIEAGGEGYRLSVGSSTTDSIMHTAALSLSVVSIFGKEWLYRYTM